MEALTDLFELDKINGWGNTAHSVTNAYNNNGGLDALEDLQRHPNLEVYQMSTKLLTKYFEVEGDMEGSSTQQQQTFFNI